MKNLFLLFMFFCAFPLLAQQEWDLFPLGQQTWFAENDSIHRFYNDSTLVFPNERQHLFGAKYLYENLGDCTDEVLTEFWIDENLDFTLNVDTLQSNADFFFQKINNDTLKFYHLAEAGETWLMPTFTNDSFQITCLSFEETDIFDFSDSLKTYSIQFIQNGIEAPHPLNDENFLLSKNSGFTQFFPLKDLYFSSENTSSNTLIGMKKAEDAYGHIETFTDYFHYEIGDILKWHSYDRDSPDVNFTATEEWFIDTITSINIVNNLLRLNVNRTIYIEESENGIVTNNFTEVSNTAVFAISKLLMDSLLHTPIHHPVAYFQNLRYLRRPSMISELGITATADYITPKLFLLQDCSTSDGADDSGKFSINTTLGLTEANSERAENGSYFLELLGYKTGDFLWGELEAVPIISNILEAEESAFEVYPNPANEVIHISFPQNVENSDISVYNSQGQLLMFERMQRGESLRVSHLVQGVYFLHLQGDDFSIEKRIVINN